MAVNSISSDAAAAAVAALLAQQQRPAKAGGKDGVMRMTAHPRRQPPRSSQPPIAMAKP